MTQESENTGKASPTNQFTEWIRSNVPGIVLAIGLWEVWSFYAGRAFLPGDIYFPSFSSLLIRAYEMTLWNGSFDGCYLCHHAFYTFERLAAGLAIASVIGVVIGIVMSRSRWAKELISPTLRFLLPIPVLALAPVLIRWLGRNDQTIVVLTALAAVLPIIAATWDGVNSASSPHSESSPPMETSGIDAFWSVTFPAALPCVLSGVRIGLARARTAVIVGELFITTDRGLGYGLFVSIEDLDFSYALVCIATISLLALLVEKLIIRTIEKATVLKWGMEGVRIANPGYTLY